MQLTPLSLGKEAIYEEILRDCGQVDSMEPADLNALELKMHSILEHLPFPNRLNCIKNVATLFKKNFYDFHQEPTVPILITDNQKEIQIPYSLFLHSGACLVQSDDNDENPPCISLPWKFTNADLEICARFLSEKEKPIPDFAAWLRVKITAERFNCDDRTTEILTCKKPLCRGSLEELGTILYWCHDLHPSIAGSMASDYINTYVNSSLANGKSMQEICEALCRSGIVKNGINKLPIKLYLDRKITQKDLALLADVLQNVVSLHIKYISYGTVFPTLWTTTLLELKFDSPQILEIPKALLSRLQVLTLLTPLQDYTTLNNLPNLQQLHLSSIDDIHSVPSGCSNLKVFKASYCPQLEDFSSLNNLSFLEECDFVSLPVTAAPSGCHNLKGFSARDCSELREISGLNDLRSLTRCSLTSVFITAAPSGCHNLNTFEAINCPELRDVSGLRDSRKLRNYWLRGTLVDGWQATHEQPENV